MKKLLILPLLFLVGCSTQPDRPDRPPQDDSIACIEIYQPVCGKVEVQCVTAPCDPVEQTFPNDCYAKRAQATDIVPGECKK